MKTILFFIIFVCSINANLSMMEKYPTMFRNKRSIMAIMTQIEATLKAKGPYDAITRVLEQYREEINDEQAAHDSLWADTKVECDDEQSFRKNAITEANAALKEAQQTLDSCTVQQQRATNDKQISATQLLNARTSLGNLVTERRQDNEAYTKLQQAFAGLLVGIEGAFGYLNQFEASSFIDLTKHTNKILLQASQVKATRHLADIMKLMVEVSAKAGAVDAALLQKLIDLFTDFKEKTLKQQKQSIEEEERAVEAFNITKERLENTIQRLVKQIEDLTFELAQLKTCISTQTSLVISSNGKLDRNTLLLNDSVRLCDSAEKQYVESTASRKDEGELLDAINEKVRERFAEIEGNVRAGQTNTAVTRGSLTGEQIDDSYANKSKYEEKKFAYSGDVQA